ncbi:MAG: ActS/PrrB/RegB family redox-sensitive histidine kinase [Azospirillaceae bacterium]
MIAVPSPLRPSGATRSDDTFGPDLIGGVVSLRTLILIRWIAIVGQATAVGVSHWGLGYAVPVGPLLAVIGVSVLLNLAAMAQGRTRVRLGERDAVLYLGYDLVQLSVLLFLTGGLMNPFSVLLLGPLTVSAATLSLRSTVLLTGIVLVAIGGLGWHHYPLPGAPAILEASARYTYAVGAALIIAAVFVTAYVWRVADEARRLGDALGASRMALEREQRAASLGALAAAAAHELGTPLATISLVSRELADEIGEGHAQAEDVALLRDQAERCRAILAELTSRPDPGADGPFDTLTLVGLIEAAAGPHRRADIDLLIEPMPHDRSEAPIVPRRPELIHGLGNLIQNAMQFAHRRVTVHATWSRQEVRITIADDGPGFPASVLSRIGEPYVSGRRSRAGGGEGEDGGHMGLGIFIASTLLEHTGGRLSFAGGRGGGAQVAVRWRRSMFESGR